MTVRAFMFVVSALLMLVPGMAGAQSSDPAWLDEMKDQIQFDKQCTVVYLMNMREGELGGQRTYEARVQCEDGRMFDATRTGTNGMFEFKACETQVC